MCELTRDGRNDQAVNDLSGGLREGCLFDRETEVGMDGGA